MTGPQWNVHFPGLMDWELDRLRERARSVEIDEDQLAKGQLVVRFEWPFGDGYLALEAYFPASYPFTRPQVRLLKDREDWPERHVNPVDGTICLLGRDTAQWSPAYFLAGLLKDQLENALRGEGAEDPQAEPADVWWNGVAPLPESYCLIDSAWSVGDVRDGRAEFYFTVDDTSGPPRIRGYIKRMLGSDGAVLAEWAGGLPVEIANTNRHLSVRWHRLDETLLPSAPIFGQLKTLRQAHLGGMGNPTSIGRSLFARPYVFLHPIEHLGGSFALGWIFGFDWNRDRNFDKPKGNRAQLGFLPILRAGAGDLHLRVPEAAALRGKRVAVVGVGAIGAPIVLGLARNGAAELRLVDHDTVEPGNSERWPLGAASWGRRKVDALNEHAKQQFPRVKIVPIPHQLGVTTEEHDDDSALALALDGADLVVDAAVSFGISYWLWDQCQRRGLPLVKVGATPTLGGGSIVVHFPAGGCPCCLQRLREDGVIDTPPGQDDAPLGIQPPGCSERTFTGADYDLQELSLQCVRATVEVLRGDRKTSAVLTLALMDAAGRRSLPRWTEQPLPRHAGCCAPPEV